MERCGQACTRGSDRQRDLKPVGILSSLGEVFVPRSIEQPHLRLRALDGYARFEAAHELEQRLLDGGLSLGRYPGVDRVAGLQADEPSRRHADHGGRHVTDRDLLTEGGGRPIPDPAPVRPADNGYRRGSRLRIARLQESPHGRRQPQRLEVLAKDVLTCQRRMAGGLRTWRGESRRSHQIREHVVPRPHLFVVGQPEAVHRRIGGVEPPELDEPPGVAHGKRPQDQDVNQAEDGGVGANAEREGQRDDDGECPAAAQHANGVVQVLEHRVCLRRDALY